MPMKKVRGFVEMSGKEGRGIRNIDYLCEACSCFITMQNILIEYPLKNIFLFYLHRSSIDKRKMIFQDAFIPTVAEAETFLGLLDALFMAAYAVVGFIIHAKNSFFWTQGEEVRGRASGEDCERKEEGFWFCLRRSWPCLSLTCMLEGASHLAEKKAFR